MKDTISVIFASIFLVLLIVILPLFSILDRQDNIAYNVVLTQTSKFVDQVRANGFITEEEYINFISTLASTGNTYNVTIEAYKHKLIETSPGSNQFTDELELYNTEDVADFLTNKEVNEEVDDSNRKQNIYLFDKNDEIYVRVYNTNITAGSVMYNMLMGAVDTKVIDIKYGGVVNNINWELYNNVLVETIATPKVMLSVPVNAVNDINVVKIMSTEELKAVECIVEDYGGLFATPKELCADIPADSAYKYIYDLEKEDEDTGEKINQKITVAAKFEDVTQVQVREPNLIDDILGALTNIYDITSYDNWSYITSNNLLDKDSSNIANRSSAEKYIIENYIVLNGIEADINLTTAGAGKYDFLIELTNVKIATLDAITEVASISVLSGLGRNEYHDLTIGDETINFEVTTKTNEEDLVILGPYNWKQLLKTKVINASIIGTDPLLVYRKQELFFRIQYTGFSKSPEEMKTIIASKLKFERDNVSKHIENTVVSPQYFTAQEMLSNYGVTVDGDSIIVKIKYPDSQGLEGNRYLYLDEEWIDGMPEKYSQQVYYLERDTLAPNSPTVVLTGTEGKNGWYTSDVAISVTRISDKEEAPEVARNSSVGVAVSKVYSGVWRTTAKLSGAQIQEEKDLDDNVKITANGTTYVELKIEDYAENSNLFANKTVKIDKEKPSDPVVTFPTVPASGWYSGNVKFTVATGTDSHSGFNKTTYFIEGSNATGEEKTYTGAVTLTESGISRITIKNYDNAGNTSSVYKEIKIDNNEPATVTFENIRGLKRNEETEWYHTEVVTRVKVHFTGSASQKEESYYEVVGDHPIAKTKFTGSIIDIELSGNGTHTLKVYTYTTSNERVSEHVVKIDEDAPKEPIIDLVGEKGIFNEGKEDEEESAWYIGNVRATITLDGDEGPSGINSFTYITQYGDEDPVEVTGAASGTTINFTREGITLLTVKLEDVAGNEFIHEEYIRIDKTAPTPAQIVISSITGENDWHRSSAYISYEGQADSISDISYVTIEIQKKDASGNWVEDSTGIWNVGDNTNGKKVILTTYNGAALSSTTEEIIKIDTYSPNAPSISLSSSAAGPKDPVGGVYMKGGNIVASITAGTEVVDGGNESGIWKTTYTVTCGGDVVVNETVGLSVTIPGVNGEDKYYSIIARTYDMAGNFTEKTASVRVCRKAPAAPSIVAVNGVSINSGSAYGPAGSGPVIVSGAIGIKLEAFGGPTSGSVTASNPQQSDEALDSVSVGNFVEGYTYTIYVRVTDIFGHSAQSSSVSFQCKKEENK